MGRLTKSEGLETHFTLLKSGGKAGEGFREVTHRARSDDHVNAIGEQFFRKVIGLTNFNHQVRDILSMPGSGRKSWRLARV